MAQGLDHQVEGRGGLPTARVVQVVPRPRRAPILQDPLKASGSDVRQRNVLGDMSEPETVHCGSEDLEDAVEHELAVDPDGQFLSVTLELPGIKATIGGQAQVDA